MNNKITITLIGLTSLFGATASNGHSYVSAKGGYTHLMQHHDTAQVSSADGQLKGKTELDLHYKGNFNTGIEVGQKIGAYRTAIEGNFTKTTVKDVKFDFTATNAASNNTIKGSGKGQNNKDYCGYILTFMLNGYYDFHVHNVVTPFVGLGIGYARVKSKFSSSVPMKVSSNGEAVANPNLPIKSDGETDGAFAYQAMVGLQFAINKMFSIFAEYKFMGTTKAKIATIDLSNTQAGITKHSYDQAYITHNANLGFTFAIA